MVAYSLAEAGLFLAAFLATGVLGWQGQAQYGEALVWTGLVVIMIGLVSLVGQWGSRTDISYQYGRTAAGDRMVDRYRQDMKDTGESFRFVLQMLLIGLPPMAAGVLLQALAR